MARLRVRRRRECHDGRDARVEGDGRFVADVRRSAGAHAPAKRVSCDDVEARKSPPTRLALRHAPGGRGQRRWGSPLVADRVAGQREGADALHTRAHAQGAEPKAARTHHEGTLAHRARVRRPQGRTRARSLRRTLLSWLAPPCHRRSLLLCVRPRRALAAFSPLARKGASSLLARTRGVSVTSWTPSSPCVSPLPAFSFGGYLGVPDVITLTLPHAQ